MYLSCWYLLLRVRHLATEAFSGMLDGFAHQIHKSLENGSRRGVLE